MTLRIIRFIVALTLVVGVGLFISALRDNDTALGAEQESVPGTVQPSNPVSDSVSPSQESAAKIQQIRTNSFFYQAYGKVDPFKSLVDGNFEQTQASELANLNSAKLVGVFWDNSDHFALVEDGEGFGYILRVGDRVLHGRVTDIRENSLSARLTIYGISNTTVLKLETMEG
jgi:hypothetical protein